jgi:uncharacterized membrane protein YbhN (UPF0104 family)
VMKSWWKQAVGVVIAAVILFFIVRNLVSGLRSLGSLELRVSVWRIVLAFGILGVLFSAYGGIWQYILRRLGYGLGFGRSMRIWFLSQAGRYVPGKVWFALGRIYLCERAGVPRAIAVVAMGLELVLVLGSAIVVFGIASIVGGGLSGHEYMWGLWLVPAIVVGVHPRIIKAVLKRIRREPGEFSLAYGDTLKMLVLYVLCWCIYGLGFYLVATSVELEGTAPVFRSAELGVLPEMIGINAVSWAGGLLSVVTPAGLGVREGISGMLLSGLVDKPYPSLIPLVARVWVTIGELGTLGLVFAVRWVR